MRQAIVTGGGTGIGAAVAARLVAEGAQVVVLGRRADVLRATAARVGAVPVVCDVTDPRSVQDALGELPDRVDVLVNNAGSNTDLAGPPPGDVDAGLAAIVAGWQANLESNLLSAVLMTAAVQSRIADGGRVVSIGSIAARTGAGSYGAAKAAVEAWNVDLAGELGPRGITANVVAPGLIEATEFFHGRLTDSRRDALVASTRTGRAGTPEDVAATVCFLAGADAGHITGQVLHVNGGAHLGH